MKCLFLILFVSSDVVFSQIVRRATLLQHRAYTIEVLSKTMQEVENFEWCNLKIPDFSQDVEYTIFGRKISGKVSYTNGYVVSIQHLDILESSVQQVWAWNAIEHVGTVDVRAQLRLQDVVLGFDVDAELDGKKHWYTATFMHRLIRFNFSILKNMATNEIRVTVTGVDPASTGRASYLPNDEYTELLGTSFRPADTVPGLLSWGPDVFQPFAYQVVTTKVEFPTVCHNC